MGTVTSKDGTPIAFDRSGAGPAIILVVGAFSDRATGALLAHFLERHFTVFNYDRRGRGESGDMAPYAIEREIEDLDALISQAGDRRGGKSCDAASSSAITSRCLAEWSISHVERSGS
jgi:pimeloyl-ACP methyl ester carboxylesterase